LFAVAKDSTIEISAEILSNKAKKKIKY
jgi:hypothetical protein